MALRNSLTRLLLRGLTISLLRVFAGGPGAGVDNWQLEEDTSNWQLEEDTSVWLLEEA